MRTWMSLEEYRRSKARVKTAIRGIEGIKKVAVALAKEECNRKLDDLQYQGVESTKFRGTSHKPRVESDVR